MSRPRPIRRRILLTLAFFGFMLPPILMVQSAMRDTTLTFFTKRAGLYINSDSGIVEIGYVDDSNGELRSGVHLYFQVPLPRHSPKLNRIAITWPDGHFMLELPWWFIWLFTGAPGGFLLARRLSTRIWKELRELFTRRHIPGVCRKCGYDLRASPDRCPECGTWRED